MATMMTQRPAKERLGVVSATESPVVVTAETASKKRRSGVSADMSSVMKSAPVTSTMKPTRAMKMTIDSRTISAGTMRWSSVVSCSPRHIASRV